MFHAAMAQGYIGLDYEVFTSFPNSQPTSAITSSADDPKMPNISTNLLGPKPQNLNPETEALNLQL